MTLKTILLPLSPIIVSLCLLFTCWTSIWTLPLWMDELFTVYFVTDPSLKHMLQANRDTINMLPPLHFFLLRFWILFFGASILSMRLFTCLCICGGLWVIWAVLQRHYRWAASPAVFIAFLGTPMVFGLSHQVRQYGLLFLFITLALWHFDVYARRDRFSPGGFISGMLIHAGIILTHTFGALYSVCLLGMWILWDTVQRRFRLPRYLTIVAGWLIYFLLWGKIQMAHTKAVASALLIPVPTNYDYWRVLIPAREFMLITLFGVLLLIIVLFQRRNSREGENQNKTAERLPLHAALLPLTGLTFVFVPTTFLFIVSRTLFSCYYDRYFLPATLGWCIIISAILFHGMNWFLALPQVQRVSPHTLKAFAGAFIFLFALLSARHSLIAERQIQRSFPEQIAKNQQRRPDDWLQTWLAQNDKDGDFRTLPIVCTFADTFVGYNYYAGSNSRYYFVIDKEYSARMGEYTLNPRANYVWMEALQRHYVPKNIISWKAFRAAYPRFLVYDDLKPSPSGLRWSDIRCEPTNDYACVELAKNSPEKAGPQPVPRLLLLTRKGAY